MATPKIRYFRPYLSAEELAEIISLLPRGELYEKLKLLQYKITNGLTEPARVSSPKPSLPDSLGLGVSEDERKFLSGEMSPEEELEYMQALTAKISSPS